MTRPDGEDGAAPSPSQRVQLEVDVLDGDRVAGAPAPALASDVAGHEVMQLTVLVVAAEADVRRYVRECLRDRADLRLLESATPAAAVALAATHPPALLVLDEAEREAFALFPWATAIVMVDEAPRRAAEPEQRVRLLARPFTAEGLLAEVSRLLG